VIVKEHGFFEDCNNANLLPNQLHYHMTFHRIMLFIQQLLKLDNS